MVVRRTNERKMIMVKYGMTMFENNTVADDVTVLVNLINQLRDCMAKNQGEPTAYDESNKIDWSIDDVLSYIESEYSTTDDKPVKCF